MLSEFPLTRNDDAATRRVVAALERRFGTQRVSEVGPATASEDFGLFGTAWDVPSVFWVVGGIDPATYEKAREAGKIDTLPANHAPNFAPVIDPTLRTGVEAMLAAAGAWLQPAAARLDMTATAPVALLHGTRPVRADGRAGLGGNAGVRLQRRTARRAEAVRPVRGPVPLFRGRRRRRHDRDVLIGAVPPVAITDIHYFLISIAGGLITFYWYPSVATLQRQILLFDAVGLALFAVIGAQKAIDYGINSLMAAILGMITGIGGGMTRDLLAGDVPFVLRGDLYAIAALAAGATVALGHMLGVAPFVPMLLGAGICVFLRLMAIYRGWRAPIAPWGGRERS